MKIDFTKVTITVALGQEPQECDMRKDFANIIYKSAKDVLEVNTALKIFNSQGETEYSDEEVSIMREAVKQITYYAQRHPFEVLLEMN